MTRSLNRVTRKVAAKSDESTLIEFNCSGANIFNCSNKLFVAFGVANSAMILQSACKSKDWRLLTGKLQGKKAVSVACPFCWVGLIKQRSVVAKTTDDIVQIVESLDPERKFITDEIFDKMLDDWDQHNSLSENSTKDVVSE